MIKKSKKKIRMLTVNRSDSEGYTVLILNATLS